MKRVLIAVFIGLVTATVVVAQTTNMGLLKPTPGVTIGPSWATMINTMFEVIDAHDHTPGKGVRITPAGMSVNTDLGFQSNKAKDLRQTQYTQQSGSLSGPSEAGSVYNCGGNLCWTNSSGVVVQVTSGGSVNNSVTNAFTTTTPGGYPYAVTTGDVQKVVLVETSGAKELELPAATTGMLFLVKDTTGQSGSNPITLTPDGSDTVDGADEKLLSDDFGMWFIIADGVSNWSVGTMPDQAVPSGSMSMFAGATAPPGYLLCNGAAVSRTTYAKLFSKIGTTWGTGDGSTTFNIPDMRQRFPLGKAASGTGNTLGAVGGEIDHDHSTPAHYHGMGTGADLNITSSGSHLHTIDHNHASQNTDSQGAHTHFTVTDSLDNLTLNSSRYVERSRGGSTDFDYDLKGTNTAAAIGLTSSNGAHTHALDLPNFTGNSGSASHTHASGDFAGRVGLVTGGVNGNAAMTSGTENPPFAVVNYIIKY